MTALIVNPGLEFAPLDAACAQPSALCTVETGSGTRRYAMPLAIMDFVDFFDGSATVDEAIAAYRSSRSDAWSETRLRSLISSVLLPRSILVDGTLRQVEAPGVPEKHARGFLTLRVPLLRGRALERAAASLSWLFDPWAVAAAVPAVVILQIVFFLLIAPGHDLDMDHLHAGGILALMALSTVSTLTHEFGHVAAAAKYRCRNLEIGWGLYMIFTVMYSDVTEAWRLPRRQRMVVDFGGVYLQSISLAGFIVGYALSGEEIWLIGFLFSTSTIVASANPILRLDGYWIISDYFGIINLRATSVAWAKAVVRRHLLRTTTSSPATPLPRGAMLVVGIYFAASLMFMAFVAVFVVQHVLADLVLNYPDRVSSYLREIHRSDGFLPVVQSSFELLWRSMVVLGIAAFVYRYGRLLVSLTAGAAVRGFRVEGGRHHGRR